MKRLSIILLVLFIAIFAFADKGRATMANPNSAVWADDVGDELFYPSNPSYAFEVWDTGGLLAGSTFGFFFEGADVSDPANLVTIFGPGDETVNPLDPSTYQSASINFDTGFVWDIDAVMLQSSFTASPGSAIGFFFYTSGVPLFTVSSLNAFGMDLSASFQSLSNPTTYLIGFEGYGGTDVAFEIVSGITPVPEPSTLLLLGTGLVGVAGYSLRRRRRQAA